MDFSIFKYRKTYKGFKTLYFDFDIREFTQHSKSTFKSYHSLINYLISCPEKSIYLTRDQVEDFYEEANNIVVNIQKYQEYCKALGQNGQNRAQAFFARKIRHYSVEEEQAIVNKSTEEQIVSWFNNLSDEAKKNFINRVLTISSLERPNPETVSVTDSEFTEMLTRVLSDPKKQEILVSNYSRVQIDILENHKIFIENNLDKNEEFIQHWVDGKIDNNGNSLTLNELDIKRLQKSRRLIFGLEFTSHEREVLDSGQRMDILARINPEKNKREYTLFELKAPSARIFEQIDSELKLSERISRAIPQVLDYKDDFENKKDGDADLARRNLPAGKIVKCIILIGTRNDNERANKIFRGLKDNFSNLIEIWTYTDLINRLETTISNLKENL